MDQRVFDELKSIAASCFVDAHDGLDIFLAMPDAIPNNKLLRRKFNQYKIMGKFPISAQERCLYLIGMIDAILWIMRCGYLDYYILDRESDLMLELPPESGGCPPRSAPSIVTDAEVIKALTEAAGYNWHPQGTNHNSP